MFKAVSQVVFSAATMKLHRDIRVLSTRRNKALSIFRKTAERLGVVNADLNEKVAQMDTLTELIAAEKSSATQMIHDNEAVRTKMLEILGISAE